MFRLFLFVSLASAGVFAQSLGNPLDGLALLKPGASMRASSCDPNWKNGNGDARPIEVGKTLVIADLEGPGIITHIWNTIASSERGYSRLLTLRIYWDGEENPSVETPIGDFFGVGHGIDRAFSSLPVSVTSDGRGRNCYWPMPFRKSAKITVTNDGAKRTDAFYYYVDWRKLDTLPDDDAYFHAQYRQEFPAVSGVNYMIADLQGKGHYVGTVLSIRQHLASWWGEGDDFWFIDGEEHPRLRGTGSEDYLCDGWGLREIQTPFYGVPLMQGYDPFSCTTAFRWHITDPVIFNSSLRLEIEHKGVTFNEDGSVKSGFEERSDDFSSVAFWYQVEPHKPFPALPAGPSRLYYDWSKLIEAETLLDKAVATEGPVSKQDGGSWSGGAQLFWTPATPNQTLSVPIEIPSDGRYELVLVCTHSFDYGVFQVKLDDRNVGPQLNLYSATIVPKETFIDIGEVTKGSHTLQFVNQEKSAESKGCFLGLDGILLNPEQTGK